MANEPNGTAAAQAQQPANVTINTSPAPRDFPEMPFSFNLRALGPEGFEEQFTVRAVNEKPFLDRIAHLKRHLVELEYKPIPTRGGSSTAAPAGPTYVPAEETVPLCIIHNTPMKRRTKDGRSWWSCTEKLADGQWCNYRPKEKP